MESLLLLIPLTVLIVIAAAVVFFRAADNGQFDDLERQGRVTLFEETTIERDTSHAPAPTSSTAGSQTHK